MFRDGFGTILGSRVVSSGIGCVMDGFQRTEGMWRKTEWGTFSCEAVKSFIDRCSNDEVGSACHLGTRKVHGGGFGSRFGGVNSILTRKLRGQAMVGWSWRTVIPASSEA